ncbi:MULTISPECIES: tRNA glutamyl-Q(34) synthetase GluQRS [unclassified Rhizobium]|uniref:tRNA glutamyl-Q(34) synthetase GluQRS n=1 Tax=unclassified Rhizobium TaxID=2613769 RepID=UPI001404966A|nr:MULTISPECIES: tRNA glutamyl-Q(34) synthetase GluQRS [unclassified Rhizobium]MBB3399137.1 glutamyl-Q tRNA(Asp) synthetase [Rhizobium sp. BK060]MBB4172135.1 glutamyl-Q tRNA(Asp) synthetase [Rhizobium sp. BK538]
MTANPRQKPVFRFAPSPNGPLHLGHALSAFLNRDMAISAGGRFLLRIEDIDLTRCTPELEAGIYADLEWLGIDWERPVRRQSEHFAEYQSALERLIDLGLAYPAFMTRGETRTLVAAAEADGKLWPRDPDGSPLYPPDDRERSDVDRRQLLASGLKHAWRLDMGKTLEALGEALSWEETGDADRGLIAANPGAWGDVILSRSDAPSSYHLSVVLDDALQDVTHVVRGLDLFHSTSVHRLLQTLLGLPAPVYHHHRLITDEGGRKLSKSESDTGLAELRGRGLSPTDIRRLVGL